MSNMMMEASSVVEDSQDLDVLQSHGINAQDIKKLKSGGIGTLKGLQMVTKKKLCAIKVFFESRYRINYHYVFRD